MTPYPDDEEIEEFLAIVEEEEVPVRLDDEAEMEQED